MDEARHEGPSSNERVRAMLARLFPEHAAAVERLIAECERFRDLCDDYLECRAVLRRLGQPGDASACKNCVRERMDEYEEMRAGLEQELIDCIEDRAICPRCGSNHVEGRQGANPKGAAGSD